MPAAPESRPGFAAAFPSRRIPLRKEPSTCLTPTPRQPPAAKPFTWDSRGQSPGWITDLRRNGESTPPPQKIKNPTLPKKCLVFATAFSIFFTQHPRAGALQTVPCFPKAACSGATEESTRHPNPYHLPALILSRGLLHFSPAWSSRSTWHCSQRGRERQTESLISPFVLFPDYTGSLCASLPTHCTCAHF